MRFAIPTSLDRSATSRNVSSYDLVGMPSKTEGSGEELADGDASVCSFVFAAHGPVMLPNKRAMIGRSIRISCYR